VFHGKEGRRKREEERGKKEEERRKRGIISILIYEK
jgi:hypothetical protein